jgi:hypothetical protein
MPLLDGCLFGGPDPADAFDETPAPGWFPILKAPQLNYSQKARICF